MLNSIQIDEVKEEFGRLIKPFTAILFDNAFMKINIQIEISLKDIRCKQNLIELEMKYTDTKNHVWATDTVFSSVTVLSKYRKSIVRSWILVQDAMERSLENFYTKVQVEGQFASNNTSMESSYTYRDLNIVKNSMSLVFNYFFHKVEKMHSRLGAKLKIINKESESLTHLKNYFKAKNVYYLNNFRSLYELTEFKDEARDEFYSFIKSVKPPVAEPQFSRNTTQGSMRSKGKKKMVFMTEFNLSSTVATVIKSKLGFKNLLRRNFGWNDQVPETKIDSDSVSLFSDGISSVCILVVKHERRFFISSIMILGTDRKSKEGLGYSLSDFKINFQIFKTVSCEVVLDDKVEIQRLTDFLNMSRNDALSYIIRRVANNVMFRPLREQITDTVLQKSSNPHLTYRAVPRQLHPAEHANLREEPPYARNEQYSEHLLRSALQTSAYCVQRKNKEDIRIQHQ